MRVRRSARVLLLDEQDRLLLFQFEDPTVHEPGQSVPSVYWATVGGALEEGETFEQAARREIREETGFDGVELGPCVWIREKVLNWKGELIRVHERYFLARIEGKEVVLDHLSVEEREVYRSHRWWTYAELRDSDETFFPPRLAELLAPLLEGRIPLSPVKLTS